MQSNGSNPVPPQQSYHTVTAAAAQTAQAAVDAIRPTGIYAHLDHGQVWVDPPLMRSEIADFRSCCGRLLFHNVIAEWDHRPRNERFRQCLQISQPSDEVIKELAGREHHLNQTDAALDWTFDSITDREEAFAIRQRFGWKRWHGDQGMRPYHGDDGSLTIYSGQAWQHRTVSTCYQHKPCRVTGELFCVHNELRLYGSEAHHSVGIHSLHDWLSFDVRKFWRRYLLMATVDTAKLGRRWRLHWFPSSQRRSDRDGDIGSCLFRAFGPNTQEVIDLCQGWEWAGGQIGWGRWVRLPNITRCLVNLNVDHLLPSVREAHTSFSLRPWSVPNPRNPHGYAANHAPGSAQWIPPKQHALRYALRVHGDHDAVTVAHEYST